MSTFSDNYAGSSDDEAQIYNKQDFKMESALDTD